MLLLMVIPKDTILSTLGMSVNTSTSGKAINADEQYIGTGIAPGMWPMVLLTPHRQYPSKLMLSTTTHCACCLHLRKLSLISICVCCR